MMINGSGSDGHRHRHCRDSLGCEPPGYNNPLTPGKGQIVSVQLNCPPLESSESFCYLFYKSTTTGHNPKKKE